MPKASFATLSDASGTIGFPTVESAAASHVRQSSHTSHRSAPWGATFGRPQGSSRTLRVTRNLRPRHGTSAKGPFMAFPHQMLGWPRPRDAGASVNSDKARNRQPRQRHKVTGTGCVIRASRTSAGPLRRDAAAILVLRARMHNGLRYASLRLAAPGRSARRYPQHTPNRG